MQEFISSLGMWIAVLLGLIILISPVILIIIVIYKLLNRKSYKWLFLLIPALIVGTLFYIFLPDPSLNRIDSNALIRSESFQNLHSIIIQLDSIKNIAVLPQNEYIVVDGLVINLVKRTFGNEPELGFYQTYYDEGSKNKFSSIDSLLKHRHIDSAQIYKITTEMKKSNITDIGIKHKAILYRWEVSAMYGEEGVLYSDKKVSNDSLHYNLFEQIAPSYYHFTRHHWDTLLIFLWSICALLFLAIL